VSSFEDELDAVETFVRLIDPSPGEVLPRWAVVHDGGVVQAVAIVWKVEHQLSRRVGSKLIPQPHVAVANDTFTLSMVSRPESGTAVRRWLARVDNAYLGPKRTPPVVVAELRSDVRNGLRCVVVESDNINGADGRAIMKCSGVRPVPGQDAWCLRFDGHGKRRWKLPSYTTVVQMWEVLGA
jgi:hypothetical protein